MSVEGCGGSGVMLVVNSSTTEAPVFTSPQPIVTVARDGDNADCRFTFPFAASTSAVLTYSCTPYVIAPVVAVYNPVRVSSDNTYVTIRAEGRTTGTLDWDGTVGIDLVVFSNGLPICYFSGAPDVATV